MKILNTKEWGIVKIPSIFKVIQEKTDNQAQKLKDGNIPLVSAGKTNNGIVKRIAEPLEGSMLFPAYSITIDMFGKAFFQPEHFYAVSHARVSMLIPLYESMRNKYVGLFISAVLSSLFTGKSSYTSMCTKSAIEKASIWLPLDTQGQPNWAYMKKYMKSVEERTHSRINFLQSIIQHKPLQIDTVCWKAFVIGSLFEKLKLKFKKDSFNKNQDVSLVKTEEFDLPLVNAKHSNNGIMYYGRSKDFESSEMTIDIVQNGAASTGDVYPQPQFTGVLFDAYLIKPIEDISSPYILFFLASVLQRCIKHKFSYHNKATWDKVKKEYIMLPVTSSGSPDWDYMENYMKSIEERCKGNLNVLKQLLG